MMDYISNSLSILITITKYLFEDHGRKKVCRLEYFTFLTRLKYNEQYTDHCRLIIKNIIICHRI